MAKTKPPAVQVLFEPWAEGETPIRWDAQEAFAGVYWIDALNADGMFTPRGYRAKVHGCTTCYRHADDPKRHWPDLNTLPDRKRMIRCPQWKTVEAIVKAFGGWKRTHYVELAEHEGLEWQPIPQRKRVACRDCDRGTRLVRHDDFHARVMDGRDMLGRITCPVCRGSGWVPHEGPMPLDRWRMTDEQRRIRKPENI